VSAPEKQRWPGRGATGATIHALPTSPPYSPRDDISEQLAAVADRTQWIVDLLEAGEAITISELRKLRNLADSRIGNAIVIAYGAVQEAI
jgi:hypothetical protein